MTIKLIGLRTVRFTLQDMPWPIGVLHPMHRERWRGYRLLGAEQAASAPRLLDSTWVRPPPGTEYAWLDAFLLVPDAESYPRAFGEEVYGMWPWHEEEEEVERDD